MTCSRCGKQTAKYIRRPTPCGTIIYCPSCHREMIDLLVQAIGEGVKRMADKKI